MNINKKLIINTLMLFSTVFLKATGPDFVGESLKRAQDEAGECAAALKTTIKGLDALENGTVEEKANGLLGILGMTSFINHWTRKANFSKTKGLFLDAKSKYEELFLAVSGIFGTSFYAYLKGQMNEQTVDSDGNPIQIEEPSQTKIQLMLKHYLISQGYSKSSDQNTVVAGNTTAIYDKDFYDFVEAWIKADAKHSNVFRRLLLTFIEVSFYKESLKHISLKACASHDIDNMMLYFDEDSKAKEALSRISNNPTASAGRDGLKGQIRICAVNLNRLKKHAELTEDKQDELYEENVGAMNAIINWAQEKMNMLPENIKRGESIAIFEEGDFDYSDNNLTFGATNHINDGNQTVNLASC